MSLDSNRILIAEDHYVSRHLLERNLTNWGFDVVTAEDGAKATEILERDDAPSLAILDWMMPIMDGPATIRVLESMDPHVKIIAASGLAENARQPSISATGSVRAVLAKPYTAEKLLRTVSAILAEQA